jgi:hypothetical protein
MNLMNFDMLILALLLIAGPLAPGESCSCAAVKSQRWLTGNYQVKPVAVPLTENTEKRLARARLLSISADAARSMLGGTSPPVARYYYLGRVAYIGGKKHFTVAPPGLTLSIDESQDGVAYVTSFLLTKENGTSSLAVVLTSDVPLKGLVSLCSAAE